MTKMPVPCMRICLKKIEILVSRGLDREKLQEQLLLTPSCGTGTLPEKQAEKVYRVLAQLVEKL